MSTAPKTAKIAPDSKRHDYAPAQTLVAEGFALTDAARKTGIPYGSLKAHAAKHHWLLARKQTTLAMSKIVDWGEKANQWRSQLAKLMDKRIAVMEKEHDRKLDLDEMEKAGRIIDIIDKTQRRQMGLDDGSKGGVNIAVIAKSAEIIGQ